ncbi:MAG: hypothetical protein AWT59_3182, partial [Candidatus Gallionella acididurans]
RIAEIVCILDENLSDYYF